MHSLPPPRPASWHTYSSTSSSTSSCPTRYHYVLPAADGHRSVRNHDVLLYVWRLNDSCRMMNMSILRVCAVIVIISLQLLPQILWFIYIPSPHYQPDHHHHHAIIILITVCIHYIIYHHRIDTIDLTETTRPFCSDSMTSLWRSISLAIVLASVNIAMLLLRLVVMRRSILIPSLCASERLPWWVH